MSIYSGMQIIQRPKGEIICFFYIFNDSKLLHKNYLPKEKSICLLHFFISLYCSETIQQKHLGSGSWDAIYGIFNIVVECTYNQANEDLSGNTCPMRFYMRFICDLIINNFSNFHSPVTSGIYLTNKGSTPVSPSCRKFLKKTQLS